MNDKTMEVVSKPKIVMWPDWMLRVPCTEVSDEQDAYTIIEKLWMVMDKPPRPCIGLAANQIGYPYRIFVMNFRGAKRAFINPVILRKSDKFDVVAEGCLSLTRDVLVRVPRKTSLTLQWGMVNGCQVTMYFDGLEARCIQHEMDHLNGIMITQYRRRK